MEFILGSPFTQFDGYYVALIIITVVTIAISIALSFFFIFIPSQRIVREFDSLEVRGQRAFTDVTNLINTTTNLSSEIQQDTCESLIYTFNKLFGRQDTPIVDGNTFGCILSLYCINTNPLLPQQCVQYIRPEDIPTCCATTPQTCPGQ